MRPFVCSFVALLVSSSWQVAQSPTRLPSPAAGVLSASHGVSVCAGEVCAGGPGYTARFRDDGAVFVPLRGPAAAPSSLQFTFVAATRGDDAIASAANVAPIAGEHTVDYPRGALVERYETRADGIEQCFVFAQRPAGHGDLVVRGRITTTLPLAAVGDGGVRYETAAGDGVHFGAVTGVDARGATVRGAIRVLGDELELSLPAAFVDGAAYPLVLDPLIGAAFAVGNVPVYDDVEPAVAYDETNGRYLVVWAVDVPAVAPSPAHRQIRGQFVQAGGGLQGVQVLIAADASTGAQPALANVNSTNRFLVAWRSWVLSGNVTVRSVSAATGAMSNPVVVATSSLFIGLDDTLAVGGDFRSGLGAGQSALLVYRSFSTLTSTSNTINACRVQVPSSGDPVVNPAVTVANTTNLLDDVAVSPHCGSAGRWLVAFGQSVVVGSTTLTRIPAQVVDDSGVLCGTPVTIVNNGSNGDVRTPAIGTRDGNEFVVTWHDAVANTVKLRRGVVSGACGSTSWTFDAILSPIVQAGPANSPAIVFARDKYVLAWQQLTATGQRVFTKGLDPVTCAACGREERVDGTLVTDGQPALASRWDGGDTTGDGAMAVWSTGGGISARHWVLHGTPGITALGGGCGSSGFNDYATYDGQPYLGSTTFSVQLFNPTAPILALIVGFTQVSVPCGPCTLVPALDMLLPGVSPTVATIPCDPNLIGADFYVQWLQFRPSGCSILPDFGFSNALQFTIAE